MAGRHQKRMLGLWGSRGYRLVVRVIGDVLGPEESEVGPKRVQQNARGTWRSWKPH